MEWKTEQQDRKNDPEQPHTASAQTREQSSYPGEPSGASALPGCAGLEERDEKAGLSLRSTELGRETGKRQDSKEQGIWDRAAGCSGKWESGKPRGRGFRVWEDFWGLGGKKGEG